MRFISQIGRFPLLRILNTTTSMLFGRVKELSIKYLQSITVVVFSKVKKGNQLFPHGSILQLWFRCIEFTHNQNRKIHYLPIEHSRHRRLTYHWRFHRRCNHVTMSLFFCDVTRRPSHWTVDAACWHCIRIMRGILMSSVHHMWSCGMPANIA